MSKQLIDGSEIWREEWYHRFNSSTKLVYRFLLDHVDSCGLWTVDPHIIPIKTGVSAPLSNFLNTFGDQVIQTADKKKWFLQFYIRSVYGNASDSHKAKVGARKVLEFYGLLERVSDVFHSLSNPIVDNRSLRSSLYYVLDIPSLKISQSGKGGTGGKTLEQTLEEIYKLYPRKLGKANGMAALLKTIHDAKGLQDLLRAVHNYALDCSKKQTEEKYIKHFSSFIGPADKPAWRDWVDYTPLRQSKPKHDFSYLKD